MVKWACMQSSARELLRHSAGSMTSESSQLNSIASPLYERLNDLAIAGQAAEHPPFLLVAE